MNTRRLKQRIGNWEGLSTRQQAFEDTGDEWVFRGQSDPGWPLRSSLERGALGFNLSFAKVADLEIKLILEFIRHYHLYGAETSPRPGDTLDWLALMRHHGAPTRLVDFTFSFQIATYFALEDCPAPTQDSVVYAINKSWLTKFARAWAHEGGTNRVESLYRLGKFRDGEAFRQLFLEQDPKLVCAVSPFRPNRRLTVQKGIFLCPGNVGCTFLENLKAVPGYKDQVLKIPISSEQRINFLRRFDQEGLNRSSLFPGLDGFAQSLRARMLLLSHLQDLEKSGARTSDNIGLEILKNW